MQTLFLDFNMKKQDDNEKSNIFMLPLLNDYGIIYYIFNLLMGNCIN